MVVSVLFHLCAAAGRDAGRGVLCLFPLHAATHVRAGRARAAEAPASRGPIQACRERVGHAAQMARPRSSSRQQLGQEKAQAAQIAAFRLRFLRTRRHAAEATRGGQHKHEHRKPKKRARKFKRLALAFCEAVICVARNHP